MFLCVRVYFTTLVCKWRVWPPPSSPKTTMERLNPHTKFLSSYLGEVPKAVGANK